jgi:hypothetical protein
MPANLVRYGTRYAVYHVLYRESNINRKAAFGGTKIFRCSLLELEFRTYRELGPKMGHTSFFI